MEFGSWTELMINMYVKPYTISKKMLPIVCLTINSLAPFFNFSLGLHTEIASGSASVSTGHVGQ